MEQMRILLDPTAELEPVQREPLPRPASLAGLTVGLLDISKARGDIFLDRVAERLQAQGVVTRRYKKPTFARVAPTPLQQQIATECDVVIEALAD
jgi:3-hydroxyacyl-CoA dehydrogenase